MKKIHNLPDRKTLRQKLRHNATPAERVLWRWLKKSGLGVKFRRQHGVGPYVLDFYCPERKLAIEIHVNPHTLGLEILSYRFHPAFAPEP